MSFKSVEELVADVKLVDIAPLEISGRSSEVIEESGSLFQEPLPSSEGTDTPSKVDGGEGLRIEQREILKIARHDLGDAFKIRLRVELGSDLGEIVADYEANYELDVLTTTELDEAVMLEFCNRVAIMALFPYIRLAISDLSLRIFYEPVVLPILKRGQLEFIKSN